MKYNLDKIKTAKNFIANEYKKYICYCFDEQCGYKEKELFLKIFTPDVYAGGFFFSSHYEYNGRGGDIQDRDFADILDRKHRLIALEFLYLIAKDFNDNTKPVKIKKRKRSYSRG